MADAGRGIFRVADTLLLVVGTALFSGAGLAQDPCVWPDSSAHQVKFVSVEKDIKLEVLDWGGSGRAVVLLAGSGNTAHVFDGFAEKLSAACCHVYGITRRGYGMSSHPDAGYSEERLAEDVLQVLHFFKISAPVLMGHSMAGEELTRLGDEHSADLAGLVYIDAASDPTDFPASSPAYMALYQKLPEAMRSHSGPSADDKKSFTAYHDWRVRTNETPFPEADLHNTFVCNPDGSVGKSRTSQQIMRRSERERRSAIIPGSACRCWHFFPARARSQNINRRARRSAWRSRISMRPPPRTSTGGRRT